MSTLVSFTMDNLSDAADLGRGKIASPRQPGMRPALEVGFPAMLDLYARYDVLVTHFVEGWNGEAHPEAIQRLLACGHEIGMHGWQHENWSELNDDRAYELALQATLSLEKVSGVRPVAFRAPGGARSPFTAKMLATLGYQIDASLSVAGEDGGSVEVLIDDLWTVPYQWSSVDATHWLWDNKSPEEVEKIWRKVLVSAAREGRHVCFIWHPHIMGIDPDKCAVGEKILEFVAGSEDFEIVSLSEQVKRKKGAGHFKL